MGRERCGNSTTPCTWKDHCADALPLPSAGVRVPNLSTGGRFGFADLGRRSARTPWSLTRLVDTIGIPVPIILQNFSHSSSPSRSPARKAADSRALLHSGEWHDLCHYKESTWPRHFGRHAQHHSRNSSSARSKTFSRRSPTLRSSPPTNGAGSLLVTRRCSKGISSTG